MSFDFSYEWQDFSAHYAAQLQPGITCILGPSGGGKSTLLALLGGYLESKGDVHFNGQSISSLAPFARPITTLFQSDNLFPQLTVADNVALGLAPSRSLNKTQQARLQWALEQVQLADYELKYPEQLSGGQAQRVAIARVLVRDQPILLLDEPFSALDPKLREDMLRLIKQLTEEHHWTTLMVTHAPGDALLLGGQVMLVEAGQITAYEEAAALEAGHDKREAFLGYLGTLSRTPL
nr:ATP-binding cassette domain-containing protein [Marinomonas ostreistagni]